MPTHSEPKDNAPAFVTAAFVIIGNEILSGRTRDANLEVLARALDKAGIRLEEVRVIRDDKEAIIDTIRALRSRYDQIFTSGGIGPTHDDITCDSIAAAFNVEVHVHAEAKARLQARAEQADIILNEARMRMARIPVGASLIDNPVSAAPGFSLGNVHVMAGVPSIFKAMVRNLLPRLPSGARMQSVTIQASLTEGSLAADLAEIQVRHDDIEIGSYPYYRAKDRGTMLVLRGLDRARLAAAATDVQKLVRDLGADPVIMENEQNEP